MKKYIILILLGLMSLNSFASHIIGGEITYKKLSGDNYQIDLTLFRDCFNGVVSFDNPATITVFDMNGTVLFTKQLVLLKDTIVPLTGNIAGCSTDTFLTCVSKGFYSDMLNLPPLVGGYTIAYQRCCRSATILNLENSGSIGATYWTHIPGPEVVATNSSPLFTIDPPFYVYTLMQNTLNQSATDSDGDSLSYFFATVFYGADQCCPMIGGGGVCGYTCSVVGSPPPYTGAFYSAPYSAAQPIRSLTPLSIHPTTGIISLMPTIIGDYAIGLGIREYRNQTLIGTYYRDFHMKAVPCSSLTPTQPPTGTAEIPETDFRIFPNPADQTVIIELSNGFVDTYYTLADVSGRIILRRKIEGMSGSFDVTEFSKGLYFLKIDSKDNRTSIIKKLIIE